MNYKEIINRLILEPKMVSDSLKIEIIWKINEMENNMKLHMPLPKDLVKLKNKYIYTPISKNEYIDDLKVILSYDITYENKNYNLV
jgi:hypothetical protein